MYICSVKDYYYILGISRGASLSEIQLAYKKLSLKFHPKENGNDPFFAMHYGKIKEAYDLLSDDHKRFRYDKALEKESKPVTDDVLNGPAPVVASFFTSKKSVQKGDLLTISWEVLNAELVKINLIGTVASNGTQTIRLPEIEATEAFLHLNLEATNSTSSKTSTKVLALKNLTYSPQKAAIKQRQDGLLKKSTLKPTRPSDLETESTSPSEQDEKIETASPLKTVPSSKKTRKKKTKSKKTRKPTRTTTSRSERPSNRKGEQGIAYVLIAVMFFLIAIMLFAMHRMNPIF
ncbi:MAG: DnaJ domain-containing protein [uncultured Aureispira sp.]|uniref:DnaJ domain-containing protein n=1 Tax=uncultured Aureispira sp. TaxID=1331704 RepID=A0A6S6U9F5_9BACT|nr:MAG: DnaJ domain-containing protein [uncultured Aureispira sp.]